jgi:isopenicillin-N epimerase
VVTNHGYNACNNAVRFATQRVNAVMRVADVPFPLDDPAQVIAAIEPCLNSRTRLLLIDHVTSPTGLVYPVNQLVRLAHGRGIRVMIDGAHAPGMLPLDLRSLGPDYYTANHHKWWCAPKVSGFLYVRPEYQNEVQPTIISHAYNRPRPGRSQFLASFDWMGTHDPTPLLALPTAISFLSSLREGGMLGHMQTNRLLALQARQILCETLEIQPPAPDEMIGSMATLPLDGWDDARGERLGRMLYEVDRIEVPIFAGLVHPDRSAPSPPLLRISLQAYNDLSQVERLAEAVRKIRRAG